jgi:exopolyphosphatase/guanosine-5'-triphosphate,3'-diphosphate pyrophosphatase
VEDVARKFGVDLKHARRVASFAQTLFESLRPLHHLGVEWGRLLEASALLRDTGHMISDTAHHKHSQYIVTHSDLPGFTDLERSMVAMLCRYHRKAMPGPRHADFQAMGIDQRRVILLLAPILRMADALDRGREQRVESVECGLKSNVLVLTLHSEQDTGLEQWAAERASESFQQVYERPVVIVKAP